MYTMGAVFGCKSGRRMHENPYEDEEYVNYDNYGNINGNSLMRKPKILYARCQHLPP